jgi:2,4-dichlorophenol 6-monooxygenase
MDTGTMVQIIEVPVIVVCGGSCGLTTSCFLSDFGVEHVLFERHATTSVLPKAHYLNQWTMEILRQHKMSDEIVSRGAPLKNFSHVAWATSFGGDGALDRRVIHKFACFGGDDKVFSAGNIFIPRFRASAALKTLNKFYFYSNIHNTNCIRDEHDFLYLTL